MDFLFKTSYLEQIISINFEFWYNGYNKYLLRLPPEIKKYILFYFWKTKIYNKNSLILLKVQTQNNLTHDLQNVNYRSSLLPFRIPLIISRNSNGLNNYKNYFYNSTEKHCKYYIVKYKKNVILNKFFSKLSQPVFWGFFWVWETLIKLPQFLLSTRNITTSMKER